MGRAWAFVVLVASFAGSGCTEIGQDVQGDGDNDRPTSVREGVVLLEQDFTVTYPRQSGYPIEFTGKERNVILEIRQDSGVLANLHVGIGPCGGVDVPGSASWETYAMCDTVDGGSRTEVTMDIRSGGPTATGRFLVRADIVS